MVANLADQDEQKTLRQLPSAVRHLEGGSSMK